MNAIRWLAAFALLGTLLIPPLALAQDASPVSGAVQRETLVEMTIPSDLMPDEMVKVLADRVTVEPGLVAEFDKDDEGIRGRTIYIETGTLTVEPVVASLVWRSASAIGAAAEIVQPGDAVELQPGDSMYLPALPKDAFPANGLIRISNPGNEPAVFFGVHLHESGGGFSAPAGYSYSAGAGYYDPAGLEKMMAGDTLFRLTRVTADPQTVLPYTDGAIATFYQIDSGEVTLVATGETPFERVWPTDSTKVMTLEDAAFQELHITGDGPAHILELAVIPASSTAEIQRETLVEMTITPDQMPAQLVKIAFDRRTLNAGVTATFDTFDEGMQGNGAVLEQGELLLTSFTDALVWHAGGAPTQVAPGQEVRLVAGDAFYLPAIDPSAYPDDAVLILVNPGTEPAIMINVHLHRPGGRLTSPPGYSYSGGASYFTPDTLALIQANTTVFRFARVTAEPGARIEADPGALVTFYQLEAGQVTQSFTPTDTVLRWRSGAAYAVDAEGAAASELRVTSDTPAELIVLSVIPSSASAMPAGTPVTATEGAPAGTPVVASPVAASEPAEGAGAPAAAATHPIVGTWVLLAADPSIPFALMQFHADGTVTNLNPNTGEGVGVWVANADGSVQVNAIFFDIDIQVGSYAPGTVRTSGAITVDSSGNRFEVVVSHLFRSPAGDIIDRSDLPMTGTRLTFAEIPGWLASSASGRPELVSTVETVDPPADHPIVGTWAFKLTSDTSIPTALVTFNSDGTAIDHNTVWGTGVGIWAPNADGSVSLLLVFQDIELAYGMVQPGVSAVEGLVSLEPGGDTLTAVFNYPLFATDGTRLDNIPGEEQAVRLSTGATFTWRTLPEAPAGASPAEAETLVGHPAVGAWIVDNPGDPGFPIAIALLHADGTVVVRNPAVGLALGVWQPDVNGTVTLRIFWQDIDVAPELASPGLISTTTVVTLDATGNTGTAQPAYELTDESGTVVGSGSYSETLARFTIESDPGWTEPMLSAPTGTPSSAEVQWESTGGPEPLRWAEFMAIDPDGNIWVADGPAHRFQIISPDGDFLETWGAPGSGDGQFDFQSTLYGGATYGAAAFDADGNLYVADPGNHRVQKFGSDRTFLLAWGGEETGESQFQPIDIAVGTDGMVYVSDPQLNKVLAFDPDGRFLFAIGQSGTATGSFSVPWGLGAGANGTIWVADYGNYRIQEFDSSGNYVRHIGEFGLDPGSLKAPNDVAVDAAGNIYVVEQDAQRVQVFAPDGMSLFTFGEFGTGAGQFEGAAGIVVDAEGGMYVSDVTRFSVQKFSMSASR